ncbi:hypothetical protein B4N89_45495 [Embleya scabrispora]|uniref:Uncharacterized protein n=1 Tax=Embleya scabrispora TaxID=159449 RepID=A0A1T3NIX3_9ACTN|nr:hypothetical protein [Embleya scabrispora]OPC76742.1 hypothetical protein B4N89_45495 [Embleya scabrispora]
MGTVRMVTVPELDHDARAWAARPGRTRIGVTGDPEAARRIHAILRDRRHRRRRRTRPLTLPGQAGTVTMAIHCDREGVTG